MTNINTYLTLSRMGYTICSEIRGVYHLRRNDDTSGVIDSVALLYCPGPIDQIEHIKFLEFDVSQVPNKEATIPKIVEHWGLLDARRIEASGIDSYAIPRTHFGTVIEDGLTFPRPGDHDRLRHAVRMSAGETLCFN